MPTKIVPKVVIMLKDSQVRRQMLLIHMSEMHLQKKVSESKIYIYFVRGQQNKLQSGNSLLREKT